MRVECLISTHSSCALQLQQRVVCTQRSRCSAAPRHWQNCLVDGGRARCVRGDAACSSSIPSSSSIHSSSRTRRVLAAAGATASSSGYGSGTAQLDDEDELAVAGNFYDILGVSPGASQREIKAAYKMLMKDVHPDLSGDEESTEFAVLLNDIYETLMDAQRRATYDALAGFSSDSINPFMDGSMAADMVFVDELTCIGCRNCANVCPRSFEIEDEWGRARVVRQGVDSEDKLQEAIDTCPVTCISWVTPSQLSLLEVTMATMQRTPVWSLMSGGGGGRDVFTEASISWEKRQAEARARVQQEADAASIWNSWFSNMAGGAAGANMYAQAASATRRAASAGGASSSGSYDGGDFGSDSSFDEGEQQQQYSGGGGGGKEGERIAKLAAKAARAARAWKSMQELERRKRAQSALLIPAVSSSSSSLSSVGGDDA